MAMILHANALDVPADLFAACDTLIVDPPYSVHVHANATSVGAHDGRDVRKRDLGFAALTPELRACIALAARSVRRWSAIFSDVESTHTWREACAAGEWPPLAPDLDEQTPENMAAYHDARAAYDRKARASAEYIRTVPWIRWSQPQLSGDRPCTGAEMVSVFHRAGARNKPVKKRWNGPGSMTHLSRRALRGADKHPTEKPLDLMLDLVSWFSDPGETVIDLCAGRGTTALACRLLGRECVAIEYDADEAERATVRIASALSERDAARAAEWCVTTHTEASATPTPTGKHDVRTWERAQRRLLDVTRVAGAL
jgi:hypothetical protein